MSSAMGVGTNLPLNFLGQGKLTIECCPLGMECRKIVCLSRVCVSESCVCLCVSVCVFPQYLQLLKESINYGLYYRGMLILVMGSCNLFQACLFSMSFLTSSMSFLTCWVIFFPPFWCVLAIGKSEGILKLMTLLSPLCILYALRQIFVTLTCTVYRM